MKNFEPVMMTMSPLCKWRRIRALLKRIWQASITICTVPAQRDRTMSGHASLGYRLPSFEQFMACRKTLKPARSALAIAARTAVSMSSFDRGPDGLFARICEAWAIRLIPSICAPFCTLRPCAV